MTQTAKPKLLFVDDSSKRIHSALRKYGEDYDVTIAPNVPEALRLLSAKEWDVVSLDFDLDGNDFGDPDSKTCGMEIVRYIQKTGWPHSAKIPTFIIHSSNSFATNLMWKSLSDYFLGSEWSKKFRQSPLSYVKRERFVYDENTE